MQAFSIQTEKFQGPIELLLELIESRKMHISDVSLREVADAFLSHIEKLEELPVADTADFVYVASILILIKSKSLLPGLELEPEEQASIDDLEKRLAIYKILKEQTGELSKLFGSMPIYSREESANFEIIFASPDLLDPKLIFEVINQVLASVPKAEALEKKSVQKVISLEEMIVKLADRMQSTLKSSFKSFTRLERTEKVNVIISFLAMLELVKRGAIEVRQHAHFDDIEMEISQAGIPVYNS
ncbi:MAG TPA: segregation/condensation protein A [Candidatus Paceibacterota bacterium]